ncbi:hypothetical protein [Flavobacterium soyae]|uniref:AAA domain-containing protein n=1 Tax=Flavobacterium soyae TaxID=2903098 RepID=A0ABZ2UFL8_9FLAO
MEKIKIEKFKAFENEVILELNKKNLLVYGENGSGKSSLYESIKILFFKQKLESTLSASTPEDLEQLKNHLWESYNNRNSSSEFEIELNNISHKTFSKDDFQVFMISIEELIIGSKLNLKELLNNCFLDITNVDDFCNNEFENIQNGVNESLTLFIESISIEIDKEDEYSIKIYDTGRSLETKSDIKKFFNEAKLNIIVLLILLNSIEKSKNGTLSKVLVLDDFITSLDISNRTFIIRYIFEKFQDFQILIFTHNISFYNLIMYVINESNNSSAWMFSNLYEINNNHKFYIKNGIEKVQDIKNEYNNLAIIPNANLDDIGNRIRKKFEILLYEYSKLIMIGAVEDSKKILERIMKGLPAYFHNKETASDLVNKIEIILSENNPINLAPRLQTKIDEFKYDEYPNFQKIVKELKLYQKVTMHPMSHGVIGMGTFTTKEIKKSIELLEKMENYLKELVDNNVATV